MRSWETSSQRVAAVEAALGTGPWRRDRLLELGLTARQLERDVAAGRLVRLRPGLYATPEQAAQPTRTGRAGPAAARSLQAADPGQPSAVDARVAREVLTRFGPRAALSHETCGRSSGLWLPFPVDDRVQVTQPGAKARADSLVRVHGSALDPHEVAILDGVRTTSVPRTAVDLARGRTFRQALVTLDSAVRLLVVGRLPAFEARAVLGDPESAAAVEAARTALVAAVDRAAGWRGVVVVRDCLEHIDARSESPYESWSRGVLIEGGVAPSAVGLEVLGASGRSYVADFAWEEYGLLGEVDGLTKYGDDPAAVRAALAAERRRQRDLEDAGWVVVRWTAGEPPERILARVRRALGR